MSPPQELPRIHREFVVMPLCIAVQVYNFFSPKNHYFAEFVISNC